MLNRGFLDFDADDGARASSEQVRSISFAGSQIEDSLSLRETGGESVSVQVLIGDRRVFYPRQISFTRPFQHWRTLGWWTGVGYVLR